MLGKTNAGGSSGTGAYARILATAPEGTTVHTTKGSKDIPMPWKGSHILNPDWRGLPEGYTQLDWIESTGTQYIDTDFYANQDTSVEIKGEIIRASNGLFFGGEQNYGVKAFHLYTTANMYDIGYGTGGSEVLELPSNVGDIFTYKTEKNIANLTVNGNHYNHTFPYVQFSAPYSIWLFGLHRSIIYNDYARIYYFKLWQDNTLRFDFVPCRNPQNEIGMYNLVSETFFGNDGTGSFTAGPETQQYTYEGYFTGEQIDEYGEWEVEASTETILNPEWRGLPEGYTQVDWIESDINGNWFDTGIPPSADVGFEVDFVMGEAPDYAHRDFAVVGAAFGGREPAPYDTKRYGFWGCWDVSTSSNNNFQIANIGENYVTKTYTHTPNAEHIVKYNVGERTCILDDETIGITTTSFTTIVTIALFAVKTEFEVGRYFLGKIKKCKFYNYSSLSIIADYVPAIRDYDDEVGLYDMVNDVFLENQSINYSFIAGPETQQYIPGETATDTVNITSAEDYYVTLAFKSYNVELTGIGSYGFEAVDSPVNPDPTLYDGVYRSTNYHLGNTQSVAKITFSGYKQFTVYIRSYGESNYDYTVASTLDAASYPTSDSGAKASTKGNQHSGITIGDYTKVTYDNDGGEHYIYIVYRKDGSVDSNDDRGYFLIER